MPATLSSGTGLSDSLIGQLLSSVFTLNVTLVLNGTDVTPQIQNSLKSLTYKECYRDFQVADILDIDISDPEGLFRQSFQLSTNMSVLGTISISGFNAPQTGVMTKSLGEMWLKSCRIDSAKSGGTSIRLSATSINPQSPFRLQKNNAQYPVIPGSTPMKLSALAGQICQQDGFKLVYDSKTDPDIASLTQRDESDAILLHRILREHDLHAKITNGVMHIEDMDSTEQQPIAFTLTCPNQNQLGGYNNSGVIHWEFNQETEDCNYSQCQVRSLDPTTGQVAEATTTDPKYLGGPIIKHHMTLHTPEELVTQDQILLQQTPDQSSQWRMRDSRDLTVPTDNEDLPGQPAEEDVQENPAATQLAHARAKALHKEHNRHANRFVISMPIQLQFESGICIGVSGFTPDADSVKWILGEVEIKIGGKSSEGSTVQLSMYPAMTEIE